MLDGDGRNEPTHNVLCESELERENAGHIQPSKVLVCIIEHTACSCGSWRRVGVLVAIYAHAHLPIIQFRNKKSVQSSRSHRKRKSAIFAVLVAHASCRFQPNSDETYSFSSIRRGFRALRQGELRGAGCVVGRNRPPHAPLPGETQKLFFQTKHYNNCVRRSN